MDLLTAFGLLAALLTVSALIAGLVERAPLSFPILFLGLGALLGPRAAGLITIGPEDAGLEVVATLTLALVLFLDALNLELADARREWLVPALALGPGTLLTAGLIGVMAMLLLDFGLVPALLLGVILSSTDPVVLRDVLNDRRIPGPVRRALKVEAGTNDIVVLPAVLILIAILNAEIGGAGDWARFSLQLFALGPAAGFAVGAVGSWLIARADRRFGIRTEYQSLYGVGLVLGAYAGGVAVGGDGFLAAFGAGAAITMLNRTLCSCFLDFGHAATEMAMLLAFVLFGAALSTSIGEVSLRPALLLGVFAILVARPLVIATLLSIHARALGAGARAFIAWFGPRGLNSLLFALLVVAAEVPQGADIFAATGIVVGVSVLAHGVSATPFAAWYGRRLDRQTSAEERATSAGELFRPSAGEVERISAEDLSRMLDGARPTVVLDVRTRSQYARDPVRIPGSVRVHPNELAEWAAAAVRDVPVALYCT